MCIRDSYFGYAMALDARSGSLFVGAPGYDKSGAVFRCNFQARDPTGQEEGCEKLTRPGTYVQVRRGVNRTP